MKNFDDLFRDQLAEHAETPPGRVWESLEKRLNANAAGGKTSVGKGWYWYVGVASVAMLMGTLGWNLANKDAAPVATPAAQVAEAALAPEMEEPSTMPEESAAQNQQRHIAAVHRRATSGGFEQMAENKADEVSPYGNAAATGTRLHSYDDFDERAVACGQKLAPLNSDEEHAANGYKVNKIRKNRLVAAEMVPVSQREQVYAAHTEAVRPVETGKPVTTASHQPVRTLASKIASAHGPKKSVIRLNETGDAENTGNEINTEAVATPVAEATPVAAPPVSTSMPVPAGTATAAKSKPASEVMVPTKPTTGGAEPVKAGSDSAAQQENAENGGESEKKGLFGIFKKKKK